MDKESVLQKRNRASEKEQRDPIIFGSLLFF